MTLTDGRPAFLYALLEHKSTPDPGTPLQLLGCMVAIWKQRLVRTGASPTRLPPIIPVVFHHGVRAWTVPSSVPDCIDTDDRMRPWLDRFRYILRDLGPIPYEALSRERAVRAVLGALTYAFVAGITRRVLEPLLRDLPDDDPITIQVLRYIVRVYDTTADEVTATVQSAKPERRDGLMPTVAQESVQQGRAEGLIAGEAKGKAGMLLRLMHRRFGTLPADVEARVRNAGADTLASWSERILDAGSVADLFDDSREH